ncbi:MAG: hypothetical protein M3Y25_06985 [Thermoproteota archaeon]|nr:hypothetical protein [Thermoproteota archaeon]
MKNTIDLPLPLLGEEAEAEAIDISYLHTLNAIKFAKVKAPNWGLTIYFRGIFYIASFYSSDLNSICEVVYCK